MTIHQPVWFAWLVPAWLLGGVAFALWTGRFPFMREPYLRRREPGLYWASTTFLTVMLLVCTWVILTH